MIVIKVSNLDKQDKEAIFNLLRAKQQIQENRNYRKCIACGEEAEEGSCFCEFCIADLYE